MSHSRQWAQEGGRKDRNTKSAFREEKRGEDVSDKRLKENEGEEPVRSLK
jgi:hypothetical protein